MQKRSAVPKGIVMLAPDRNRTGMAPVSLKASSSRLYGQTQQRHTDVRRCLAALLRFLDIP